MELWDFHFNGCGDRWRPGSRNGQRCPQCPGLASPKRFSNRDSNVSNKRSVHAEIVHLILAIARLGGRRWLPLSRVREAAGTNIDFYGRLMNSGNSPSTRSSFTRKVTWKTRRRLNKLQICVLKRMKDVCRSTGLPAVRMSINQLSLLAGDTSSVVPD